jgi:arsenite methyltransferase
LQGRDTVFRDNGLRRLPSSGTLDGGLQINIMKRFSRLLGWLVLPTLVLAQDHTRRDTHEMHRLHQDPQAYIAMLDDPQRDAYQKPHEVITALNLKEAEVIADLGAGSGYFTFRLARHVGDTGRVYAVDVSPEMIVHLNRRIRDLGVRNVVSVLAAPDDPLLAEASVDRFFICNTWHHIDNRDPYLALLKKMLKPGGQIVMVDFKKAETPVGPPMEMRIDREDLVQEMERNGFRVEAEHTFLPYQYFLVFQVK